MDIGEEKLRRIVDEIKMSRKNNDEGKKIIERHCSKRINRNLLTKHHGREDNAIQITIKKRRPKKKWNKKKEKFITGGSRKTRRNG